MKRLVALRQAYDESENPAIMFVRSVTDTIGSWFDENESAHVTRLMRVMDPTFTPESFEREYIVPEVVDAYLSADQEALKARRSEAVSYLINIYYSLTVDNGISFFCTGSAGESAKKVVQGY